MDDIKSTPKVSQIGSNAEVFFENVFIRFCVPAVKRSNEIDDPTLTMKVNPGPFAWLMSYIRETEETRLPSHIDRITWVFAPTDRMRAVEGIRHYGDRQT